LLERRTLPADGLRAAIAAWDGRFDDALSAMLKEGVVTERAGEYGLD
jgi:hypothetical protein